MSLEAFGEDKDLRILLWSGVKQAYCVLGTVEILSIVVMLEDVRLYPVKAIDNKLLVRFQFLKIKAFLDSPIYCSNVIYSYTDGATEHLIKYIWQIVSLNIV